MTIQEIADIFITKYSFECLLRKIQKIDIGDKTLSFFISSAQQDIQRRLSVVESSTSIVLGSDSENYISANTYSLPSAFGKQKLAYIGSDLLIEKPLTWVQKEIALGGSGFYYAIQPQGHTSYIICPTSSGTLTIHYYPDLGYYQPSVSATQSWGSFSGVIYSGNLILPDRYNMAILYSMLSNIFQDYHILYEKELRSLKESRLYSDTDTLKYDIGGFGTESESRDVASTITTDITTIISALDEPVKRIRFRVSDTGAAATVLFSTGWSSTPTVVNSITSIVISSANAEFSNYSELRINNADFGYVQNSTSQITITPDPTTGWGEVEIILNIYE